jgi:hypothetical protein
MHISIDFSSQIAKGRGPLSHKQGIHIHQCDVSFIYDLKIRLLLLKNNNVV